MASSTIIGFILSAVALSTLVAGFGFTVIKLTKVNLTHNENEYISDWNVILKDNGKKSTKLDLAIPLKKDFPPDTELRFSAQTEGGEPFNYVITMCDAVRDEIIGKSFADAGIPQENYPRKCPFSAGNWAINNWEPPAEKAPPGIPDGPFSGYAEIALDGQPYFVRVEYEGIVSHSLPGLGR